MASLLRIAIDGGAATGKSTISKLVAASLGIKYINTGQMYRLFAFVAIKNNIVNDEKAIYDKIKNLNISYDSMGKILSNDISFKSKDLDSEIISMVSSKISSYSLIRKVATKIQIEIGKENGVLLEGRDIGTVIMKDATYKFFITVSPEEGAKRRFKQYHLTDKKISYENILNDIKIRNKLDTNRNIAPLKIAKESIIINTTRKSINEVVNEILEVVNG